MNINTKNTPDDLRNSFLNFMEAHGAVAVSSSSLLPENDPTTLFTGSGMQPMVPYLLGEKHPMGNNITNVQKCLRTVDIEEVGDSSHLTFFEMAGRWKLDADPKTYKKEQIRHIWEWQIDVLGLDPTHLYITAYQGNEKIGVARDDEAVSIWSELFESVGIEPVIENSPHKYGTSRGGRIFLYDEYENWWSRTGVPKNMPIGELGGPDSEMFFDFDPPGDPLDHPATETNRFLEIGNNVFMSHQKRDDGFAPLDRPNIDYGGGLERIAAAVNGDSDIYRTAFFTTPMLKLSELSGKTYEGFTQEFRIILDHTRAATFLIADGALPSNVDAGYVTRRLMRRAIRTARKLGTNSAFMTQLSEIYIDEATAYPDLKATRDHILSVISSEEEQFQKTLQSGEIKMQKHLEHKGCVTGADAFYFYETFGFPIELTKEFLEENNSVLEDIDGFQQAFNRHIEKSRTAAAGKFKGGLAEHSEITTALHTATHLMLAGLRTVLGEHVHQKGSNITPERARFDFSHTQKMTVDEKQTVEKYVNDAIEANAEIAVSEMPKQLARDEGVEGSFWDKYPDVVKVYTVEDDTGKIWSRELCGGPHALSTKLLGAFGEFKIQKEESSSAGVRRIKATLACP